MYILAIETSCDETACAVVKDGVLCVASSLATSKELHEATGGIVPEIAARKQIEFMVPVISQTLKKFGDYLNISDRQEIVSNIDAVAVTTGPGLIGSLLIGVEAAKALALAWDKPLIPVNHLIGHIYGNFVSLEGAGPGNGSEVAAKTIQFPAVVMIVSGGHTDLVLMKGHGNISHLGSTMDDAAGEAFDKTARLLGLSKYLGGPELSKLAGTYTGAEYSSFLPRPLMDHETYDFSFSGLKTAVKRVIESGSFSNQLVAYEFEQAVIDVLVSKTLKAAKKYEVKTILLGGGVSANNVLRARLSFEAEKENISVFVPPIQLCTDNAIYIASAAYFNNKPKSLREVFADPSLTIMSAA